jgi:hypothetical protein
MREIFDDIEMRRERDDAEQAVGFGPAPSPA